MEATVAALVFTVQEGMLVVDSAGKEIGRVAHLVREVPGSAIEEQAAENVGVGEVPGLGSTDYSPPMTTATWTGSESGYIVVSRGGIMGIGAHHLYVPFSEVTSVQAGDRLVVRCNYDRCLEMYGSKPDGL